MPAFQRLAVRDGTPQLSSYGLLIVLVILAVCGLVTSGLVLICVLRRRRTASPMEGFGANPKRLHIETTTSQYVIQEKLKLMEDTSAPSSPTTSVPEIRITFPDEIDKSGRPKSGGVVVVKIGENSAVGLEPVREQLPAYSKDASEFANLDLEKMGGLKEAPKYN